MNNNKPTSRLVEYFLVVGLDDSWGAVRRAGSGDLPGAEAAEERSEVPLDSADEEDLFRTAVRSRYPETDHPDVPFPPGVAVFCFPEGGARLLPRMEMPIFFEFVSTGENGSHLFGFVLVIFEPFEERLLPRAMQESAQLWHAPKCLCLLSHWPFRSQFRTFLTQMYRLSISPVMLPLERVVSNFVCEVPLPPPGRIRVQHQIGDTELTFSRPPANNPISWTDIGFQEVFEALDLMNIFQVFSALLTERQVLLRSTQLSLLASCGEVFRALMYPFSWTHVYIPVLPRPMLMVLQAPLPYLIGVEESILQQAFIEGYEVPVTAVVVNLDDNEVNVSSRDFAIMELPLHDLKKLHTRVAQCAPAFARRSPNWKQEELTTMDSAFSHAARPFEIDDDTAANVRRLAQSGDDFDSGGSKSVWKTHPDGSCNWPLVRTAFFRFFVSILRDYREFLVYPVQKPTSPKWGTTRSMTQAQREEALGSFDADGFLARKKRSSERAFLNLLVNTQHFRNFVDDRLHPDGAHDADVIFFEQSLEAKLNRSFINKLIPSMKAETPFLDDRQYSISKTVVANGPDVSPPAIQDELWKPKDPMRGYEVFPRLQTALFGRIRPKPETGVLDDKLMTKAKDFRQKAVLMQNEAGNRLNSASDAIYATWFILYCSAIGRTTENWIGLEEYEEQLNAMAMSGQLSALSVTSQNTMTEDLDDERRQSDSFCEDSASFHTRRRRRRKESAGERRQHRASISSVDEANRLETSLLDLATAFEVLEASQQWSNAVDEIVYRSLIDACGRCGATDYAIRVLGMMHEAGVTVDSLIYSNLVQSFSMNGEARSFKMDILDWKKLREEVQAANKRIEDSMREVMNQSMKGGEGSRNSHRHRRLHNRMLLGARQFPKLQLPSPKKRNRSRSGSGSSRRNPHGFDRTINSSPNLGTGTPLPSVRYTMQHWGSRSRGETGSERGSEASASFRNRYRTTKSGYGGSPDSAMKMVSNMFFGIGSKHQHREQMDMTKEQQMNRAGLRGISNRDAPAFIPVSVSEGKSAGDSSGVDEKRQDDDSSSQMKHGTLDLEDILPGLVIDTERETCPQCSRYVKDNDIRRGWDKDPNDYNTECASCGRRFVAFFTVYSPSEIWVGSRGPGTPLFCEFLPPWALSKEVRTILANHSIEFVCSKAFRQSKPTLYWNLVLFFSEFRLPLEFLTGPPMIAPDQLLPSPLPPPPSADDEEEDEAADEDDLVLSELTNNHGAISPLREFLDEDDGSLKARSWSAHAKTGRPSAKAIESASDVDLISSKRPSLGHSKRKQSMPPRIFRQTLLSEHEFSTTGEKEEAIRRRASVFSPHSEISPSSMKSP